MALRRFQNFALGSLSASRLNEMIDAIARLEARVVRAEGSIEPVRDRILAIILGDGTPTKVDGCQGAVAAVSYPFAQAFIRIADEGNVTDATCVSYDIPEDAIRSTRGAYLLKFEPEPSLSQGDVVTAELAPMSIGTAQDKQQVYVSGAPQQGGGIHIVEITQDLGSGRYKGRMMSSGANEIEFVNMYELEQTYGATSASIECAAITPKPLPVGRAAWVTKAIGDSRPNARYPDGSWFTCISVAFDAECTCGTTQGLVDFAAGDTLGQRDPDAAVGGMMLDRSLRNI